MRSFWSGVPVGVAGEVERVVVVGAGASGLAVARVLGQGGVDCVVLEARGRPGGRIDTIRVGESVVDQGAAWIDGVPDNPLYDLVRTAGIDTVDMRYVEGSGLRMFDGAAGRWVPRRHLWAGVLLAAFHERRRSGRPGWSVADWADSVLGTRDGPVTDVERFALRILTSLPEGADPDRIGTNPSPLAEEYGGTEHMPVGGYRLLIDRMIDGVDVRYDTQVRSIVHGSDGVVVTTDADQHVGSHVVVTVPLAILKAGAITFDPELPGHKTAAMTRMGVGVFEKVILTFDTPFWRNARRARHDFMYRSATDGELPEFVDASTAAGSPTLVAITAGTDAVRIADNPEAGYESAMRILREAFGTAPTPQAWHTTSWATDPHALGSYSFHAVETDPDDPEVLAEPVGGRLLFAGEATQSGHQGYVGGAIASGVREARRLLGAPADLTL